MSALSLCGCEENYITNKYYMLPDASDVPHVTDDAGTSDVSEPSESDTEGTEPQTTTETDTEAGSETSDGSDAGTETEPDAAAATDDSADDGEADAGDAGSSNEDSPFHEGAPTANTDVADFEVDIFGTVGNRYWFAADPAQVEKMNGEQGGGGPIIFNEYGDIYEPPGGGGANKTYVESLFVSTPEGQTADFGQLSVRVLGQSTYRPWTPTTIPNLRLDLDHFTKDLRLDGYEHLRLNNGLVGSIFREKLTLDLYRKLGYPAPRTQFAWVGSNVWGADAWIPYTLVQVYKKSFCAEYAEQWGGGCENMWEYYGDFGQGTFESPESCQSDECDNTRAKELEDLILAAQYQADFKAATESLLDWDSFHEYQCLSWILAVGDDPIHNSNNVVLVERTDGMFQFLPYSTDISLGQDWYPQVPLAGTSVLARGCQNDPACWADTVTTCERLVEDFSALDPVSLLDEEYAALETAGMLRSGDENRYEFLKQWFQDRLEQLPIELEANRESPQMCPPEQIDCDGYCAYPQDCWLCQPPVGPIDQPEPMPLIVPAPGGGDVAPVPAALGDAGAVAGDAAAPAPEVPPEEPGVCDPINAYAIDR